MPLILTNPAPAPLSHIESSILLLAICSSGGPASLISLQISQGRHWWARRCNEAFVWHFCKYCVMWWFLPQLNTCQGPMPWVLALHCSLNLSKDGLVSTSLIAQVMVCSFIKGYGQRTRGIKFSSASGQLPL